MRGFFIRLLLLALVVVVGSYVAFDDPQTTYQKLYDKATCKLGVRPCRAVAFLVLPGVSVYFVDKSLATRDGRQVAILAENWPYCKDKTGEIYEVPQYFETDFASIPPWAQFYINPQEKSVIGAAIVHDWLYAYGGKPREAAKRNADDIFRIELKANGVNFLKRNIMYEAVSLFGGKTFGEQVEMRFRDPETGAAYTEPKPPSLVIDKLAPGCGDFYAKYWNRETRGSPAGPSLDPRIIEAWLDVRP